MQTGEYFKEKDPNPHKAELKIGKCKFTENGGSKTAVSSFIYRDFMILLKIFYPF
jgi:hypothetical protein